MASFRYKAFISYSHEDEQTARWLHRRLEAYRLPKQFVVSRNLPSNRVGAVFRDREELATAGNLSSAITEALTDSENLIVICTPNAARSRWVNEEIKLFKQRRSSDRVFCVLAGDPETSFPKAALVDVDGDGIATVEESEPLAADITPNGDGKSIATVKLVAGLLGVRFDDLRRRELKRRHRRLISIAGVSFIGMTAALSLAVFAILAQREAESQRQLAVVEAATAQRVTDFLVGLFEASDPFESAGDFTVRELLNRGSMKIQNELADEPRLQARLLTTIGQVHTQLGLFDEAQKFLDDAYETQSSMPDSNDIQIIRIQIRRAWLATETGRYDQAQAIYDALLPVLDEGQLYSDVLERTEDWYMVINDLGVLRWNQGELLSAKWILSQALTMGERLYGVEGLDITSTLNNLALAFAYSTEYEAARPLYERALAIHEKVQGPDHPGALSLILNLASTVRSLGDFEAAQLLLEQGLRIANANLQPGHPSFANWYNGLGIVFWKQGNYARALERLEQAGSLYVEAYGETGPGVGNNLQHQARVFFSMGDFEKSKRLYERSIAVTGSYGPGTSSELAEVLEKLGDVNGALELHKMAIELASKLGSATNPYLQAKVRDYEEFLVRNGLTP